MIEFDIEQGTPEWHEARRGRITGSRFRDCRDRLKNGDPSKVALRYAMDVARERLGGSVPTQFETYVMRQGREQEPVASARYEAKTGNLVETVGFFGTEDGLFGLSPDRLVGSDGAVEIKTLFSTDALFTVIADGDVSEYMDQCLGYLWLLGRKWVDLVFWIPDLNQLVIRRIERDEEAIQALEDDLIAFEKIVEERMQALQQALGLPAPTLVAPEESAPAAPASEVIQPEIEAERERIRAKEEAKAKAAAEAEAKARAAVARAQDTQESVDPQTVAQARGGELDAPTPASFAGLKSREVVVAQNPAPLSEAPTLTLGAINERLAPVQISGSGVAELGVVGAKDGRATRYSEQQYRFLLAALAMHLQGLLNPETAEAEAA